MKCIKLELSDDAYKSLWQIVSVAALAGSSSPLAPVFERIMIDISNGLEVCSLKTRAEREAEAK